MLYTGDNKWYLVIAQKIAPIIELKSKYTFSICLQCIYQKMPHSTMTQDYGIQRKGIQIPHALNFCVALHINTWNIFSPSLKKKRKAVL